MLKDNIKYVKGGIFLGWTSKMRADRFSWNFNRYGEYRGNGINSLVKPQIKKNPSTDTEKRKEILKEIEKRVFLRWKNR